MQLDRWLQSSKDDITRPQPQPGWLSIRFLGNASVQMARERRKRAIAEMNNKLIELVERLENASPLLFGDQFAKEAKKRVKMPG